MCCRKIIKLFSRRLKLGYCFYKKLHETRKPHRFATNCGLFCRMAQCMVSKLAFVFQPKFHKFPSASRKVSKARSPSKTHEPMALQFVLKIMYSNSIIIYKGNLRILKKTITLFLSFLGVLLENPLETTLGFSVIQPKGFYLAFVFQPKFHKFPSAYKGLFKTHEPMALKFVLKNYLL